MTKIWSLPITVKNTLPLIILLAAIIIRIMVYVNFPIFITNDSGDYLSASTSIYYKLDFLSDGLRDARLPGYPVFLALIYPLSEMNSDRIMIAQILSGILSVVLGLFLGYLLQSKLLAFGLGLFLALNPFYLLTDHLILPESLYLTILLGLIVLGALAMRSNLNWVTGLGFGALFAICNLFRANGLIFCLTLLVGILLFRFLNSWRCKRNSTISKWKTLQSVMLDRELIKFLAASAVAVSIFLAPWLLRNYYLYQKITLVNYVNRNLLIYKIFHGTFNPTLPLTSQAIQSLTKENGETFTTIDYQWFAILGDRYPSNQAEKIAEEVLEEQINHDPRQHWMDIQESIKCFGGACQKLSGGRADIRFWFTYVIPNPNLLFKNNTQDWIKILNPGFQYVSHTSNPLLLYLWSRAGLLFFISVRPLIYLTFFASLPIFFIALSTRFYRSKRIEITFQEAVIITMGVGYLATVALHSTTLAAADRYAAPFDIISVSTILLIFQYGWENIKTWYIASRAK